MTYQPLKEAHEALFRDLEQTLSLSFDPAVSMLLGAVNNGGKIVTVGPLADYTGILFLTPQFCEPIPCLSLNFVPNYEAFILAGDAAVAFGPNGDAQTNEFIHTARRKGATTLGITSATGMVSRPDLELRIPSKNIHRVNEASLFVIHALLEGVKKGIRNNHAS